MYRVRKTWVAGTGSQAEAIQMCKQWTPGEWPTWTTIIPLTDFYKRMSIMVRRLHDAARYTYKFTLEVWPPPPPFLQKDVVFRISGRNGTVGKF